MRARRIERGRMELHEFDVAQRGTGARGDGQPLAPGADRVGAMGEEPADAAGRDDDAIGAQKDRAAGAFGDKAGNLAILDAQAPRGKAFKDRDGRRSANSGGQSQSNLAAGLVAAGVDDAVTAVRRFEAEFQAAVGAAIEGHAEPQQIFDRARPAGDDLFDDWRVAKSVAGCERVLDLQGDAVIRADAGGDAALRENAGRVFADRRLAQQHARLRRELQRRHQPGDAAADDQHLAFEIENFHRLRLTTPPACVRPRGAPAPRSKGRSRPHAASSPTRAGYSPARSASYAGRDCTGG